MTKDYEFTDAKIKQIIGTVLIQYTYRIRTRACGNRCQQAAIKQLKPINTKNIIWSILTSKLTKPQKKAALKSIMMIKGKWTEKLKRGHCIDNRKEHKHICKQEMMISSTMHLESVSITSILDTKRCKIAIIGFPIDFYPLTTDI